jgi:thymidylate synthase (FAD)
MSEVSLVHITPDAEKLVAKMARVSNSGNEDNHETAPRLLRYLIKHQHWSPFEMCSMTLKIETERDIAAQILRHRSFSFQEFSQRYAVTQLAEIPSFRRQDAVNRQSSHDDLETETKEWLQAQASAVIAKSYLLYQEMLKLGVAKESARRILPLCTPTTLYMAGTLRSWIHYINIRTSHETQLEHRIVAEQCAVVFKEQLPIIAEAAFDKN